MKISEFFKIHGWCQFVSAKDKNGQLVSPKSEDAIAWCISGAAQKLNIDLQPLYDRANRSWVSYNDQATTTKEILIAELEKYGF